MRASGGVFSHRFTSLRHLDPKSEAHKLPDERETENCQRVSQFGNVDIVVVSETTTSPRKIYVGFSEFTKYSQKQIVNVGEKGL